MKKNAQHICEIKIIPKSLLYSGIQDAEILHLAQNIDAEYHTPGTASYGIERKHQSQGVVFQKSFSYSYPGCLSDDDAKKFDELGAVVLKTNENQNIILYRNDYFSNTKLKLDIDSTLKKTTVKGEILCVALNN